MKNASYAVRSQLCHHVWASDSFGENSLKALGQDQADWKAERLCVAGTEGQGMRGSRIKRRDQRISSGIRYSKLLLARIRIMEGGF
jgi:23S rRNA maturation-related 3'-5' exoribonuclease YhaM